MKLMSTSKVAQMDNPNLILDDNLAYDKCPKDPSYIKIQMQAGFQEEYPTQLTKAQSSNNPEKID